MATLVPEATSCRELVYRSYCSTDDAVHAMRYHWAGRHEQGWVVRDHWHLALVEDGAVRFSAAGLDRVRLGPGSCRLLPAEGPHRLESGDVEGAVEIYLLFRVDLVRDLARLLGPGRPAGFPWRAGGAPVLRDLDAVGVRDAVACCDRLLMHPPPRHESLEALCTALRLGVRVGPAPYADLPSWLRKAVIQLRTPNHLAEGIQALARLAGRSVDHVNRTVRRHRGITATALVNALRLELAAARLRHGDEPIEAVAAGVGLADLSHFYRLFKAAHGTTPARYRRAYR